MTFRSGIDANIKPVTTCDSAWRMNDDRMTRRRTLRVKRFLNAQRTLVTVPQTRRGLLREACLAWTMQIPLECKVKPGGPGCMQPGRLRFGKVLLKRHVFVWVHR